MSLISPNFDVKSFFPNFGQGPFPKIAGKSPTLDNGTVHPFYNTTRDNTDFVQPRTSF